MDLGDSVADSIPWDLPDELSKLVNPTIVQLRNPISASPTALFSLLDTIQSLQTVDTGAHIFHHKTSNGPNTISSRDLSPFPLSADLAHSPQTRRQNSVPAATAGSIQTILGRSVVIPQDAPTGRGATHTPVTSTNAIATASPPAPSHDSARSVASVPPSNSVPIHSVTIPQDVPAGAVHASESPQPEVAPPVPVQILSANSELNPAVLTPLPHENTVAKSLPTGRKRKRKGNSNSTLKREQPKRCKIAPAAPPDPIPDIPFTLPGPVLPPSQEPPSTSLPLQESPVRFNRNGKPLKKSKFWKYTTSQ